MINFNNVTFVKSAPSIKEAPKGQLPEILFVGKSNVGKSTLINVLTNRKRLAFTSSKPGHTKLLNYYNVDDKIYLVDAPGYGYAKGGIDLDALFANMMNEYFSQSKYLKLVLLLLDSRRELSANDEEILSYLKEDNIPFRIVLTKADKINQKEKAALLKYLKEKSINSEEIIFTSSLNKKSINSLSKFIDSLIN